MQTDDNPWEDLHPSTRANHYDSRKVGSEENPSDRRFFWSISSTGNPALMIDYTQAESDRQHFPQFANITVKDSCEDLILLVELQDRSRIDMFFTLCCDIISSLQETPEESLKRDCLSRLECWRLFLRRGKKELSEEEQKGLIAELMFLAEYGFKNFSQEDALAGWEGPNGGHQDFSYGQTGVEIKSKRKSASSLIRISSENQLTCHDKESLFLQVVEINSETSDKGFTLQEVVDDTKSQIETPFLIDEFNKKLASAGYMGNEHYDKRWSKGKSYLYAVRPGFPKIDSLSLASGVEKVSYSIDLNYCGDFLIEDSELRSFLGGAQ